MQQPLKQFLQNLNALKKKKPIVALIENVCASAAYYIALSAHDIIASPSSLVGSIGVVIQIPSLKELAQKYNVKVDYIYSGAYKTSGALFSELTEEQRKHLQEVGDSTYEQFVADVAKHRKLNLAQKDLWANGKVFSGTQAKELGLIDDIGALSLAKKRLLERIAQYGMKAHEEVKFIPAATPSALAQFFGVEYPPETPEGFGERVGQVFYAAWHRFWQLSSQSQIR